ncbi:hypothetical protein RclHR1_39570001 [Rhizophagus clarus]|uniref:Retrotransposon gag domain-containing protein n=1 Tax=Rhizophagus clarus TaxID=94130 RepID=A0A2Z6RF60_9GLOM|nr:hypothetical protein RclHR1_39570001 [Rhizophagus clarus]
MSGLTEDSSKSSSDTTTTIEDEQLKENTESNENESQRNNKEAKIKKKENNKGYIDSSNLHIWDTSENPIGNSKSISSSSTSPLQLRLSFRYNDLYDEPIAKAKEYFDRSAEPRETRLVDFPEFKGENQDPVEWLEAFERACNANKVPENRKVILVASYLKGTALTWYNRANIQNWNNPLYRPISFVHAFTDYFCNPFKLNQWKHQLRNRKQKPGETIEDYIAAIEEL